MDLSIFATPEAWISLVTLMFLEIVLGVDNLVFIVLTSDRLPPEKQHIGRKLGLLGALVSRVVFLCFASFLVHMTDKLFTIPGLYINGAEFGLSVRDLVLFLGGLYLIYKGIVELRDVLKLSEEKESQGDADKPRKTIGLAGAVATIMVMDIVFSIDSVITAVGLANHLIVMIIAGYARSFPYDGVHRSHLRLHQHPYRNEDFGAGIHYRYWRFAGARRLGYQLWH